ncbi:hypothetical protein [Halarchaeum sp. P4]|uniref:hypothetical protein n=1 Tax=Halarchaeum sp. P4 TaxID=3421639 RepID=UPI003EBA2741
MVDLRDFGGGSGDDPEPEDEVRLKLSRWLADHGAKVYWDQRPSYGYQTFDPGRRARPDLLVEGQFQTYALEVKVGDESATIHDALPQLVGYWETVAADETEYRVDGKEREIDAFLLATGNSPFGRLFQAEGEKDVLRTGTSEGRQRAVSAGQIPEREFGASETAVRALWRFAKDRRPDAELGIGALLSSRLDGDAGGVDEAAPHALYYRPGGYQPDHWDSPGYQFWESVPSYLDK